MKTRNKPGESFFAKYAHEYDFLTDAQSRSAGHEKEVVALIERFKPGRVLDAGCATGLTSFLFATHGCEAIGLDRSRDMISLARKNYASQGLPLKFVYGQFEALPQRIGRSFDLIVCLANSIVGVGTVAGLSQSLRGFCRLLRPGGSVVIQLLNVQSLFDGEIIPVRATQHESIMYLRYLERQRDRTVLTVVRIDRKSSPIEFEVFRNESASFTPIVLRRALLRAGFGRVESYSDVKMSKAFTHRARDLVLIASKPR